MWFFLANNKSKYKIELKLGPLYGNNIFFIIFMHLYDIIAINIAKVIRNRVY